MQPVHKHSMHGRQEYSAPKPAMLSFSSKNIPPPAKEEKKLNKNKKET